MLVHSVYICFFFFNDTATTEIYTLSLHDALPILDGAAHTRGLKDLNIAGVLRLHIADHHDVIRLENGVTFNLHGPLQDRKSTRLNSSHANISYAVFCLKKKNKKTKTKINSYL